MSVVLAISFMLAPLAADTESFRTLAKGSFSGIHQAKHEIIQTDAAWEKFWAAHSVDARPAEKRPSVDFEKEMVVAVTMGRQRKGGFAIEIVRIEPKGDRLQIWVRHTAPKPGAMAIQALTAPFHFVATAKTDLKPEFISSPQTPPSSTAPEKDGSKARIDP